MSHSRKDCNYADFIGLNPEKLTDESGTERCRFCHAEWAPKPKTVVTKSTGGK